MKKVWFVGIGVFFIMFCLHLEKVHSEIAHSVIRLHIIANSDSAADQAEKLAVRDFVLENYGERLKATDREEALQKIYSCLPQLLQEVRSFSGKNVQVSVEESVFPTKSYGAVRLPSGKYLALKVILGNGNGKNWWCVLYPPLCFSDITCEANAERLKAVLTDAEYELVTANKGYVLYKFKCVEIWNKLKNLF